MEFILPLMVALAAAGVTGFIGFNPGLLIQGSVLYLMIGVSAALLHVMVAWYSQGDPVAIEAITGSQVTSLAEAIPNILVAELYGIIAGVIISPILRYAR